MFFCKISKIFKNTYFDEHLRTIASERFQGNAQPPSSNTEIIAINFNDMSYFWIQKLNFFNAS